MLTKPARILAIAVGIAMLVVESAYATRLDIASVNQPPPVNEPTVRLPGHVLSALQQAKRIRSASNAAKQPITLTLTLNRDDEAGFERYLRELYDPRSPNYRHFLTQAEITSRFGPSQQSYDAVLAYLKRHGFTLVQGSGNRMTITVRGTRAIAERALDIRIRDYRIGDREFYANDRDPALPADLASRIQAIAGISDLGRPHHAVAAIVLALGLLCWADVGIPGYANALCPVAECYSVFEAAAAGACPACSIPVASASSLVKACGNGFPPSSPSALPLSDESSDAQSPIASSAITRPAGAGQTIGLVEFDNFRTSDVSDYLTLIGSPTSELSNLSEVNVNGGVPPGPDEKEVLLDIDADLTLAPGAKVVVYDAPFAGANGSFQPVLNQMISDGVSIISNSWAYCEDETTKADVESIDSLFKTAAASGISAFNGAGDTGSTCLDGSQNVVAVPADSPHATAVGGTSLTIGPGDTYQSEAWWNGTSATPQTGQGGFGVSTFFPVPAYQAALASGGGRSVPDVVDNADPAHGVVLCQADAGGCPTGLLYSGTSVAAPVWAAFAAQLNQQVGKKLGFLNPLLYPLANSSAFHDAASLGSDFSEVGLGSPNLDALELALSGESVGAVSASASIVAPLAQASLLFSPFQPAAGTYVPDDGSTDAFVVVQLIDANGHFVGGKTVKLGSDSANAQITPSSQVSTAANGTAEFTVTDSMPEKVTFTASDSTDGITLSSQPSVVFGVPPASSASISASLGSEPANGVTADTITVTLEDALSRPTPGKLVTLSQGGANSVITALSPGVTDSSGQIKFSVTDIDQEDVTYTATDVTDGNLPVPGNATVDFTSGAGGCASASYVTGTANPAPGYLVNNFASGFVVSNGNQGFSYNCFGAYGMAWDSSGNMYVTDWPTGNIYKFGPSGGVADSGHLFTMVQAPATGVAIDPKGNMFASEGSVNDTPDGDIVPVDLSTGTVGTAIASGIECLGTMALDPSIPALFAADFCNIGRGGSNNIWEVTGIDGSSPSTTIYAQLPSSNTENLQLAVAPDGTVYDVYGTSTAAPIARITKGSPPTVTNLTAADGSLISLSGGLGMTVGGMQASGDAQFVIAPFNPQADTESGLVEAVRTVDLTGSAPAPALQLTTNDFSGLSNFAIGPDGCLYVAGGPTVSKITKADGTCTFGPTTQPPALSLTPTTVSPNPTQGGSQSFTATFYDGVVPAGTPVLLTVTGSNPTARIVKTDAHAQASFSYTGVHAGIDNVVATAALKNTTITSNPVPVTWEAGQDTTFLSLNLSPKSAMPGGPVTLIASRTDVSQTPPVAVIGQPVTLGLGNDTCGASTDSNGNASCQVSPQIIPGNPSRPITASFAGTSDLTASNASAGFLFTAPPEHARLIVTPAALEFPEKVELGGVGVTTKPQIVHVFNPKKKKTKVSVTFLGAGDTGDFAIVAGSPTTCDVTLAPKTGCNIAVTFTPTAPGVRKGRMLIADNAERNDPQKVHLLGTGRKGVLDFSPELLRFGDEAVGNTSAQKTVSIENPNPVPMAFAAATSGDFQISLNTCPDTLPAHSNCEIGVTFMPSKLGLRPGSLTFTDTAKGSPQSVALHGTGIP